jgi:hypothetical protein
MSIHRSVGLSLATAIMLGGTALSMAHAAPFMIVGNDEKVLWDDAGKTVLKPAGKDSVLIVDLANPEKPKIVATLPLDNSVIGPPVNVDIDPTGSVALVSDSVDVAKDEAKGGDALKITSTTRSMSSTSRPSRQSSPPPSPPASSLRD